MQCHGCSSGRGCCRVWWAETKDGQTGKKSQEAVDIVMIFYCMVVLIHRWTFSVPWCQSYNHTNCHNCPHYPQSSLVIFVSIDVQPTKQNENNISGYKKWWWNGILGEVVTDNHLETSSCPPSWPASLPASEITSTNSSSLLRLLEMYLWW